MLQISKVGFSIVARHWLLLVLVALAVAVALAYLPMFEKNFVSDEFIFLNIIHFSAQATLVHDDLATWLVNFFKWSITDPVNGSAIIHPARWWVMWADYFIWKDEPAGYQWTNLSLHALTSFVVALLAWQLARRRWMATVAGLLFAVQPIHAEAVSFITARADVLCGLFTALSVTFYLQRKKSYSIFAFALALAAKELAVTLPLLLVLYEVAYSTRGIRAIRGIFKKLFPYCCVLVAYLALRLILFGQIGGPPYARIGPAGWAFQLSGYTMYAADPLLSDISLEQTLLLDAALLALFWFYRSRREVVFGLLWTPIALFATYSLPPGERYFYTASIGLALAAAGIVTDPLPFNSNVSRTFAVALALALLGVYGNALFARNENWHNAGQITARILSQVKALHPTLAPESRLVFVGVPDRLRRAFVFITGIQAAIQLTYDNPTLIASLADDFPILTDGLDKTYFFEYENKQIKERADLVAALRARKTCAKASLNGAIVWDFAQDAQGWEAWNDLSNFGVKDGALSMQSVGTDPYLGSPLLDIAPQQLDQVEIEMRVLSNRAQMQGALFWQTQVMTDFSPAATLPFMVLSDGKMRTYQLNLGSALQVEAHGHLVRLRLDPADAPADITIRSIAIQCNS